MCNKISKLAYQNKYQWIGICSHGSAHVFWRTVHVCLPFDELSKLLELASQIQLPVQPHGEFHLLWLNQVAIRLTNKEYQEILALFIEASKQQSKPSTLPAKAPKALPATESNNTQRVYH
ncbi:hypothetical protein [Litoribacillus peritrichatus]|uniref:Uncharacterized protein n=1 Tax=Litoribacillus peritrichatus TaxID=718191 RepID=A0ABP7MZU1_9GAMM